MIEYSITSRQSKTGVLILATKYEKMYGQIPTVLDWIMLTEKRGMFITVCRRLSCEVENK